MVGTTEIENWNFSSYLFFWMCVNCCSVCGEPGKNARNTEYSWSFIWVIILCLGAVGVGGYAVYKYRIRVCFLSPKIPHTCTYVKCCSIYKSWRKTWVLLAILFTLSLWFMGWSQKFVSAQRYMDSEIRAIMAQYMPLDNQGEIPNHVSRSDIWNRVGKRLVW